MFCGETDKVGVWDRLFEAIYKLLTFKNVKKKLNCVSQSISCEAKVNKLPLS